MYIIRSPHMDHAHVNCRNAPDGMHPLLRMAHVICGLTMSVSAADASAILLDRAEKLLQRELLLVDRSKCTRPIPF